MRYLKLVLIILPFVVLSVVLVQRQNSSIPKEATSTFAHKVNASNLERITNEYRVSNGLKPLVHNERLCKAAQAKLDETIRENSFQHNRPDGSSTFTLFNGNYKMLGENLASGMKSAQETFNSWRSSPKHKENLDKPNYSSTCIVSTYQYYGDTNSVVAWYGEL